MAWDLLTPSRGAIIPRAVETASTPSPRGPVKAHTMSTMETRMPATSFRYGTRWNAPANAWRHLFPAAGTRARAITTALTGLQHSNLCEKCWGLYYDPMIKLDQVFHHHRIALVMRSSHQTHSYVSIPIECGGATHETEPFWEDRDCSDLDRIGDGRIRLRFIAGYAGYQHRCG